MRMKNYKLADVIKDLHDEGKSPADEMQELIEYYKGLRGKWRALPPLLQKLDAYIKSGQPFRREAQSREPLMRFLCNVTTEDITFDVMNDQDFREWNMGYQELETIWYRVVQLGEPYC